MDFVAAAVVVTAAAADAAVVVAAAACVIRTEKTEQKIECKIYSGLKWAKKILRAPTFSDVTILRRFLRKNKAYLRPK